MILTHHARDRWTERFTGLDIVFEWTNSKRASGHMKSEIKKRCPAHADLMKGFNGYYYTLSPNRVIFVVSPPEIIITCFRLPEHEGKPLKGAIYKQAEEA